MSKGKLGWAHAFRKSKVMTFVRVFLIMLVIAAILSFTVGIIGSNSELVTITMGDGLASYGSSFGTGLNISEIPYDNMLENSSFELSQNNVSFVLDAASGSSLYFSGDVIGDYEVLSGSRINIFSLDESGNMSLSYSGTTSRFDDAKFGPFNEIEDANGFFISDRPVKVCSAGNVISVLMESGKIITDVTSGTPSGQVDIDNFVDISDSASGIYALAQNGKVYLSTDGKTFSLLAEPGIEKTASGITAFGNSAFVLFEDGTMMEVESGIYEETIFQDRKINTVFSDDSGIAVIDSEGRYFRSSNGYIFSEVSRASGIISNLLGDGRTVKDACLDGDTGYILTDAGEFVTVNSDSCSSVKIDYLSSNGCGSLIVFEGRVIATDSLGSAYLVSSNGNAKIVTSDGMNIDNLFLLDTGDIFVTRGKSLYSTSLFAELVLETPITEGTVLPGDICEIETDVSAASGKTNTDTWCMGQDNDWDIYGSGTEVSTVNEPAQNYGSCAVRLSAVTDSGDIHMLSQELPYNASACFVDGEFYRISLYMKQSSLEGDVDVWLSGEGIDSVGFTESEVGSKYNEYSYVFAADEDLAGYAGKLRLNIAFEGEGELCIDGVYLGVDDGSDTGIASGFTEGVVNAAPSVIRFDDLDIGEACSSTSMIYGTCLENDLRLCKEAGAEPWLVIGSYADENTVNSLLEYLAGSITTANGLMRTDNGTALPWSRQFTNFYIEVNDTDGLFTSDTQRGAYVDYVVNVITKSPYYSELKDKVVFVDGMNYEGGTVLSSVDLHSGNLAINIVTDTPVYSIIRDSYEEYSYDAPRVSATAESGECISNLTLTGSSLNCGELISAILGPSDCGIRLTMVNFQSSMKPADQVNDTLFDNTTLNLINAMETVSDIPSSEMFNPDISDPLNEESEYKAADFSNDCYVRYCQSGNDNYLIVSNCSDNEVQFSFSGNGVNLIGGTVTRYSDEGAVIQERSLTNRRTRRTLMSGQYMIMRLEE